MRLGHARAILWVQWRTMLNLYPRAGTTWTAVIGAGWYGFWVLVAIAVARTVADPANSEFLQTSLPGALLLMFLYWQVVPMLMATSGAALDLRRLLAYPIPLHEFFGIEVLLRSTAALEMLLATAGIAIGALFNPNLRLWGLTGTAGFVAFNLFLAVGVRDVVTRLLSHKYVREIAFFLLIVVVALPQIVLQRVARGSPESGQIRGLLNATAWPGWPWSAAANLVQGREAVSGAVILLSWCAAAAVFARWQFARTLQFDAAEAGSDGLRSVTQTGLLEGFYRFPSLVLRDPLAAMIEKDLRSLLRSPRFRLVFLMGFTFGLLIWLPILFGGNGRTGILSENFLTIVSVYALLLLGEVCFWNMFGFDRSAAQIYFLAPVDFSKVLIAKNITGMVFVTLEIALIALVCRALRMPLTPLAVAEAYCVTMTGSIFLLAAGNLMSVHNPRGTDPSKSFRTNSPGKTQALLLVLYPLGFAPAGLAYLARYAFDSEWALFGMLAIDAVVGLIVYRISLESASQAAIRTREQMIARLSEGSGPIEA